MQDQHALQSGSILDRYKIIRVLGEGGFGITYFAEDIQLGLKVVIKEYFPNEFAMRSGDSTIIAKSKSVGDFSKGMQRFKEEAQILAKFNHPSIVKILGYFEANDTAYFVMEYEEGIDLAEYLKQENRALSQEEILSIMMPILEGLKEVHKYNFLHRDIKPGNILLRANKSPVLIDFGATKLALGEASKSITSMLTEGYAPLEQYSTDIKRQGPFTDLYATAAVMYKMITGEVPPSAQTRSYQLLSDDDDPLKLLSRMNLPAYDKSFLAAIDRTLAIKGKDRPQTVQEFQENLAGKLKVVKTDPPKNNSRFLVLFIFLIAIFVGGYYVSNINSHKNETNNNSQKTYVQSDNNDYESQKNIEEDNTEFERARLEQEKKERERIEVERLEKEQEEIEALRIEKARVQREELEQLRKEKADREKAKIEAEKLAQEKLAAEKIAAEYLAQKEAERMRLEKEEAPQEFPLTVKTKPSNAKVQILNIKAKYYDGIRLKRGKYKIRISKNGYESKNIVVDPSKSSFNKIVLKKIKFSKYSVRIGNKMWQDEPYARREINANRNNKKFRKVQDWKGAVQYCRGLVLGEYSDWRLPGKNTLKELYMHKKSLQNVPPSGYWSSTTVAGITSKAWCVYFGRGNLEPYSKADIHYVRCVRGGQ